ncbi:hypothetical protein ACFWBI_30705 [Streptomyces sp. NPDC059982]|uniref:hypothetical protein n=1 Tax=unclassified Streptomyces TaxID=2593676 RepID=UPI0036C6B691
MDEFDGAFGLFLEATRAEASSLDGRTHAERRFLAEEEEAEGLRALTAGSAWMTDKGREKFGEKPPRVQDASRCARRRTSWPPPGRPSPKPRRSSAVKRTRRRRDGARIGLNSAMVQAARRNWTARTVSARSRLSSRLRSEAMASRGELRPGGY